MRAHLLPASGTFAVSAEPPTPAQIATVIAQMTCGLAGVVLRGSFGQPTRAAVRGEPVDFPSALKLRAWLDSIDGPTADAPVPRALWELVGTIAVAVVPLDAERASPRRLGAIFTQLLPAPRLRALVVVAGELSRVLAVQRKPAL